MPVTDWRVIGFEAEKEREEVAALALSRFAERLAGKPIMMIISNHDTGVKTECCIRFYLDLHEANARAGYGDEHLEFLCTDDPYHTCSGLWYNKAADFLEKRGSGS